MKKLRGQLMLTYIPIILVPVLLLGLVTRNAAESGLSLIVTRAAEQQARALSSCMAEYYRLNGSWTGLFEQPVQPPTNSSAQSNLANLQQMNSQSKVFQVINNEVCVI